jgi:hypothetical protein
MAMAKLPPMSWGPSAALVNVEAGVEQGRGEDFREGLKTLEEEANRGTC